MDKKKKRDSNYYKLFTFLLQKNYSDINMKIKL